MKKLLYITFMFSIATFLGNSNKQAYSATTPDTTIENLWQWGICTGASDSSTPNPSNTCNGASTSTVTIDFAPQSWGGAVVGDSNSVGMISSDTDVNGKANNCKQDPTNPGVCSKENPTPFVNSKITYRGVGSTADVDKGFIRSVKGIVDVISIGDKTNVINSGNTAALRANNVSVKVCQSPQGTDTCGTGDPYKGYIRLYLGGNAATKSSVVTTGLKGYSAGWSAAVPNWAPGYRPFVTGGKVGNVSLLNTNNNVYRVSSSLLGGKLDNNAFRPAVAFLDNTGKTTSVSYLTSQTIDSTFRSHDDALLTKASKVISADISANNTIGKDFKRRFLIQRPEESSLNGNIPDTSAIGDRLLSSKHGIYLGGYFSKNGLSTQNPAGIRSDINKTHYSLSPKASGILQWLSSTISPIPYCATGTSNNITEVFLNQQNPESTLVDATNLSAVQQKQLNLLNTGDENQTITPTNLSYYGYTFIMKKVKYRSISGTDAPEPEWIPTENCKYVLPQMFCSAPGFWGSAPNFLQLGHNAELTAAEKTSLTSLLGRTPTAQDIKDAETRKIATINEKLLGGKSPLGLSKSDMFTICPKGMYAVPSSNDKGDCLTCMPIAKIPTPRQYVSSKDIADKAIDEKCDYNYNYTYKSCTDSTAIAHSGNTIQGTANNSFTNFSTLATTPPSTEIPMCPRACTEKEKVVLALDSSAGGYVFQCADVANTSPSCQAGYSRAIVIVNGASDGVAQTGEYPAWLCVRDGSKIENPQGVESAKLDSQGVAISNIVSSTAAFNYCSDLDATSKSMACTGVGNLCDANKKNAGITNTAPSLVPLNANPCGSIYVDINGKVYATPSDAKFAYPKTENKDYINYTPTPVRSGYKNCMMCM